MVVTLNYYKVAHNNAEKKLDNEELKALAVVLEFKCMEQKQKDIHAEKELLHRTPNKVITNEMSETHERSRLTYGKDATVELELWGLAMKVKWDFFMWYRWEVSELKPLQGKS